MDKRSDEEVMEYLIRGMETRSVAQLIDAREVFIARINCFVHPLSKKLKLEVAKAEREIPVLKALGLTVGFDGTGEMRRRKRERAQ